MGKAHENIEKCTMKFKPSRLRFLRRYFYLKLLKSLLHRAGKILDVGCGSGEFVQVAQNAGRFAVGVDIDFESLLKAKRVCRACDFVNADMFHLPFRAQAFDSIFFSHVIEHITLYEALHLLKIFRELARTLVVVTPSYHREFWVPGHILPYTLKTLDKVLKLAGYRVLIMTYDKAFILGVPTELFPRILVKMLNIIPVARIRVNLLAMGVGIG